MNKTINKFWLSFSGTVVVQRSFRCVFICTKQQIEDALGKEVYFGEILGKHSEVYGLLDEKRYCYSLMTQR